MTESLPPDILRATLGPQAVPLPKVTETYSPDAFKAALARSEAEAAARASDAPLASRPVASDAGAGPAPGGGEVLTLDEEEKRIILRTLSVTGGNISEAARRLGIHRSTLHRKMTRYGLATEEQLAADSMED